MAHLPMVRHIVGKLLAQLPTGMDVENLEAAGTLGLVEAANNFDPERGIKFDTYAFTRIRGAVLDELRRNSPLPQQMMERVSKLRKVYKEFPPPVTVENLMAATGLKEEEVLDGLAAFRMTRMLSFDGAKEPAGTRLDRRDDQPDKHAERAEQQKLMAQAIVALPERERMAVTLYYLEDLRLKEIGQLLGLSESRVSRVLNAALFEMGEYMRAREGPEE
jgi:RNA polymerase sigma factor for flagellar operon FliA